MERNALRAGLVSRSVDWFWGSAARRHAGTAEALAILGDWPLPLPATWAKEVDRPQAEADLEALRRCVQRGRPYGSERWVKSTAARLGLGSTLRSPGRPRKKPEKGS